jgi:hypothetical protein
VIYRVIHAVVELKMEICRAERPANVAARHDFAGPLQKHE